MMLDWQLQPNGTHRAITVKGIYEITHINATDGSDTRWVVNFYNGRRWSEVKRCVFLASAKTFAELHDQQTK